MRKCRDWKTSSMIAKYLENINSAVIKTVSFVKLFGYFKIYIFIFCHSVKLCSTLQPHAVTTARQASLSFTMSSNLSCPLSQ